MPDPIVAKTPNQIAAGQPTTTFKAPIYGGSATVNPSTPYTPNAAGTSVNPVGTTNAPAVHTAAPATTVSNAAQTKNANAMASAASVAAAKQNMTTTYDAQGNMIKTGGVMSNGNTYSEMYSKGQPGYIPNPADIAKQNENKQTSDLTSALTPSEIAGKNTNTINATSNASNVTVPQGIDTTTPDGQATWYNQDKQGYEQWASANNITSDEQFQVKILAGNQNILNIQNQGNNTLQQYRTGLLANEEAQISALTNMWSATINAQRTANDSYVAASAMASARAGGQYDPMGSLAEANRAIQTGLDRVTAFQSTEQEAIANVENAFLNNDYKAVTDNLAQQEKNQADMLNNLKTVNDSIVKAKDDAQAQANYVATTQYNEVTKRIQDLSQTISDSGAPQSVKDAVSKATTVQDAISAAGNWAKTSTDPAIEAYMEYYRPLKAAGKPYQDWIGFQKIQNQLEVNKAAAIAYAQAAAKNKADQESGIPSTKQQSAITSANNVLKTNPEAQAFVTTAQGYAKILSAGNATDPATQSAILASFIQMAVPGSKTLRGNSQVLSSMFGNDLANILIRSEKTVGDRGNLNPEDIASIQKAAGIIYASQYATQSAVIKGIASALNNQTGMTDSAKYLDDMSQPLNAEVMALQAKNDIDSYVLANPNDKANIAKMYATPGATDQSVRDWLKANGKIK